MIENTEIFAKTTEKRSVSSVLDDVLRSLRIAGSVLLSESYAAPWAIDIPNGKELAGMLGQRKNVVIAAFHLVEFGRCEIKLDSGEHVLLNAGDMAICFSGAAHKLALGKAARTQDIQQLLAGSKNSQHPRAPDHAGDTSLLCGVFLLQHALLNPLLLALPRLVRATLTKPGQFHNLSGVARLLSEEIGRSGNGSGYVIERLLEVLCAEAVRAFVEESRTQAGWFRALKDPVVGRAIAAIHENPGKDWSVPTLAKLVSMSPSRFAARFTETLGDSTMAYVAKWRMNIACRKLLDTRVAVEDIASEVGYESAAAFNRAFKKQIGVSPTAWRVQARA